MKPILLTEDLIRKLIKAREPVAMLAMVDKETAQWLLDRVDEAHQRARRETTIRRYLADLQAGKWIPMTDVVFDGKGHLIDGQHLLAAFIRSDLKTLTITFKLNPHPQAALAPDHGRKRSFGEDLKWQGYARGAETAPMLTVLYQEEMGYYKGTAYTAARAADQYPTAAQLMEAAKMHPDLDPHLRKPPKIFRGRGVPVAALWAASYQLHQIDYEKAKAFFTSLFEGTDIPPKSPIKTLRECLEDRLGKKRLRNGEALAWVYKTWNAWLNDQVLAKPIMKSKEPFPVPIEPPAAPPSKSPARVQ